jgi:hypothetical protein
MCNTNKKCKCGRIVSQQEYDYMMSCGLGVCLACEKEQVDAEMDQVFAAAVEDL